MECRITIQMDNAAFKEPGPELARILRKFAARVITENDDLSGLDIKAIDYKGNIVGFLVID